MAAKSSPGLWRSTPVNDNEDEGFAQLAARSGTTVQLPTRSVIEWTPATIRGALIDADSGSLARPADLVEAIMGDDRVQGVLSTRTHGLLGLPLAFQGGSSRQAKALEGVKGLEGKTAVPGDWYQMFPEAQLAQLTAWGILLGVGLGERVPRPRDLEGREVPELKVWHPRWLRQDVMTERWYLTTSTGEIEITPGDGRWILYLPYGNTRPWTQGAWRPLSFAWVLKQFALHDRARHSEVQGSPARVGVAPAAATDGTRRQWLSQLRAMARDNAMVLPFGYDYKVVEATGRTYEIYAAQIDWADRAIAVTLTGQFITTEGTKGFSNGNIHADIKHDLIKFTAETLSTTLRAQGVVPWSEANYPDGAHAAPWPRWDTDPPVDKKLMAEAMSALGDAVAKLDLALVPSGKRVNAEELAARFGVPLLAGAITPPVVETKPAEDDPEPEEEPVQEEELIAAAAEIEAFESLRLEVGGNDPPKEFRLFTAGTVNTSKGDFVFGPDEAAAVMADWASQGNELMVDYDHASLSPMPVDPAQAGKAAGWFGLELRNGELWAVNVRWTEPAAEALKRKEWRYMSPAFRTKGKKIVSVINVALTNIPATKRLEPLMAASATESSANGAVETRMDLTKVLAALGLPADATEEQLASRLAAAPKPAAPPAPARVVDADFDAIAQEAHREVRRQSEIDELREEQRASQVRELLRSTDRYTTPAFESLALARTPDEVRAMLLCLPPKPSALHAPRGGRESAVELTAAERRLATKLGQDLNALLAHKTALVERDRARSRARTAALSAELGDE